mgnify:FL=1
MSWYDFSLWMSLNTGSGMSSRYLDLANSGKNQWWRYVAGSFFIVSFWLVVGISLYTALAVLTIAARRSPDSEGGRILLSVVQDPFTEYVLLNLGHVAILAALFIAMRFIHARSLITLVTPNERIDWKRIGEGFGVFLSLSAVLTFIDYLFEPATYRMTHHPLRMLSHAPVVLVLTPIQATTEELFFRGYLLQALGRITRKWHFPAVITSLLFMFLHLANPEVQHGFLAASAYYFGIGFLFALITIKSDSLELVIGAHTAINLFTALLVNYSDSVLNVESLVFSTEVNLGANLLSLVIMALVSYWVFFRRTKLAPEGA